MKARALEETAVLKRKKMFWQLTGTAPRGCSLAPGLRRKARRYSERCRKGAVKLAQVRGLPFHLQS